MHFLLKAANFQNSLQAKYINTSVEHSLQVRGIQVQHSVLHSLFYYFFPLLCLLYVTTIPSRCEQPGERGLSRRSAVTPGTRHTNWDWRG